MPSQKFRPAVTQRPNRRYHLFPRERARSDDRHYLNTHSTMSFLITVYSITGTISSINLNAEPTNRSVDATTTFLRTTTPRPTSRPLVSPLLNEMEEFEIVSRFGYRPIFDDQTAAFFRDQLRVKPYLSTQALRAFYRDLGADNRRLFKEYKSYYESKNIELRTAADSSKSKAADPLDLSQIKAIMDAYHLDQATLDFLILRCARVAVLDHHHLRFIHSYLKNHNLSASYDAITQIFDLFVSSDRHLLHTAVEDLKKRKGLLVADGCEYDSDEEYQRWRSSKSESLASSIPRLSAFLTDNQVRVIVTRFALNPIYDTHQKKFFDSYCKTTGSDAYLTEGFLASYFNQLDEDDRALFKAFERFYAQKKRPLITSLLADSDPSDVTHSPISAKDIIEEHFPVLTPMELAYLLYSFRQDPLPTRRNLSRIKLYLRATNDISLMSYFNVLSADNCKIYRNLINQINPRIFEDLLRYIKDGEIDLAGVQSAGTYPNISSLELFSHSPVEDMQTQATADPVVASDVSARVPRSDWPHAVPQETPSASSTPTVFSVLTKRPQRAEHANNLAESTNRSTKRVRADASTATDRSASENQAVTETAFQSRVDTLAAIAPPSSPRPKPLAIDTDISSSSPTKDRLASPVVDQSHSYVPEAGITRTSNLKDVRDDLASQGAEVVLPNQSKRLDSNGAPHDSSMSSSLRMINKDFKLYDYNGRHHRISENARVSLSFHTKDEWRIILNVLEPIRFHNIRHQTLEHLSEYLIKWAAESERNGVKPLQNLVHRLQSSQIRFAIAYKTFRINKYRFLDGYIHDYIHDHYDDSELLDYGRDIDTRYPLRQLGLPSHAGIQVQSPLPQRVLQFTESGGSSVKSATPIDQIKRTKDDDSGSSITAEDVGSFTAPIKSSDRIKNRESEVAASRSDYADDEQLFTLEGKCPKLPESAPNAPFVHTKAEWRLIIRIFAVVKCLPPGCRGHMAELLEKQLYHELVNRYGERSHYTLDRIIGLGNHLVVRKMRAEAIQHVFRWCDVESHPLPEDYPRSLLLRCVEQAEPENKEIIRSLISAS